MQDPTCPVCGAGVHRKSPTGPLPTYCSTRCRSRAAYVKQKAAGRRGGPKLDLPTRSCVICGGEFKPKRHASRTCSRSCSARLHRDSPTEVCAVVDCVRPVRAKGLCASHYNATHPDRKTWKKNGQPEVRRAALRRKTQKRRAITRGVEAENIDRDVVGERDGWVCGLCGTSIDPRLAWPNPLSPSLDHVVPLSTGGAHVASNVQISHLRCNLLKGNRGGGEQLRLIG